MGQTQLRKEQLEMPSRLIIQTDAGSRSTSSYIQVTETSYTQKCQVMINGADLLAQGYTKARLVAHLGYASGGTMYAKLIIDVNESEISASANSKEVGAWIDLEDAIDVYAIQCKLASAGTSYLYGTLYIEVM